MRALYTDPQDSPWPFPRSQLPTSWCWHGTNLVAVVSHHENMADGLRMRSSEAARDPALSSSLYFLSTLNKGVEGVGEVLGLHLDNHWAQELFCNTDIPGLPQQGLLSQALWSQLAGREQQGRWSKAGGLVLLWCARKS